MQIENYFTKKSRSREIFETNYSPISHRSISNLLDLVFSTLNILEIQCKYARMEGSIFPELPTNGFDKTVMLHIEPNIQ